MSGPVTREGIRNEQRRKRWRLARRWIYGVVIAAVPLAVHYKWIEPEASPIIVPLILALVMVKDDGTPEDTE